MVSCKETKFSEDQIVNTLIEDIDSSITDYNIDNSTKL